MENQIAGYERLLDELYPSVGGAWRVGLTGPPGAGKSTLAGRLIDALIQRGRRVAFLAVDPSSPFSGGAVLGDRVRIDSRADDRLFIRSAASRGALGGLSPQSEALGDVLDAAGFDVVIVESVGAGQAEVEIARTVDSVIVVLVPESGDQIQAMKAGLLEIADILCVNKADRASADALVTVLQQSVGMRGETSTKRPAVVRSRALDPDGVDELLEATLAHREALERSGSWTELRDGRLRARVEYIARAEWERRFWTVARRDVFEAALNSLDVRARKPYSLASRVIAAGESPSEEPL